jgi:hypothetical protein
MTAKALADLLGHVSIAPQFPILLAPFFTGSRITGDKRW